MLKAISASNGSNSTICGGSRWGNLGLLLFVISTLAGCAGSNWNSIYREYQVEKGGKGTSAIIDVKQRAILSNTVYDKDSKRERQVVCAEPSPDALSVIASGASGSLNTGPSKALELALSSSETGSYIGNRTATIQLLRDMLYRACEMYMGGAIDASAYLAFQRRYQIMTMGLLAIEQITGTVKESSFALAAGSANASAAVSQLKQKREELAAAMGLQTLAKASVAELTQSVADRKKELDAATEDDAKKTATSNLKAAEQDLANAKKTQAQSDANVKLLEKEYESALNGGARASVGGGTLLQATAQASTSSSLTGQQNSAVAIATTAKEVVEMIVRSAFQQEECFASAKEGKPLNLNCEGVAGNVLELTSKFCSNLEGESLKGCVEKTATGLSLPQNTFTDLKNPASTMRQALDSDRELSASVVSLVRKLVPTPTLADLRYDIFAIPGQYAQREAVITNLTAAGAKSVRGRSVSEEQCRDLFKIPKGQPTVRFDPGNTTEIKTAEEVQRVVVRALGLGPTDVLTSPASTPTPLYMSVFLCGNAGI